MKFLKKTRYVKYALALVLLFAAMPKAAAFDASLKADSSRLSQGRWVKIKVTETGIHAITAADAQKWGMSDLSKVHVFGFGAARIPDRLTQDIPDDLPQIPVVRCGDKILFYAQGPVQWKPTSLNVNFTPSQHPYSTAGYYFVTDDSRFTDVEITRSSQPVSGAVQNKVFGRVYHEQELVNPGETGHQLLGEDFSITTTQTFNFNLEGYIDGGNINICTNFAASMSDGMNTGQTGRLTYKYNNINLPYNSIYDRLTQVSNNTTQHYLTTNSIKSFTMTGTKNLAYEVTFNPVGTVYLARLNFIAVNYERALALYNGVIDFGQYNAKSNMQYQISGCTDHTHVWDVTTPHKPVAMNVNLEGDKASFSPELGNREFVAFDEGGSNYPSPVLVGVMKNQNLHGEPTPDMIIISHREYMSQAQRLADMHTTIDSMRVLVVDQDDVFDEFSSGTPDALAYRMMCKLFYDRGKDAEGHQLGYLLLMGNGTYDNRQITTRFKTASYPALLTWQTDAGDSEITSYVSDDPLVVLGDNTGPDFYNSNMSIAVGRFPVKSVAEARVMVDKVIKYVTNADNGAWKNNVLYVADDGNKGNHMRHQESVIDVSTKHHGEDMVNTRVYLDAFDEVSAGSGRTYPDARTKMYGTLKEGVVWWNYAGHSSTNVWTDNGLLMRGDIEQNLFYRHLPILMTASCEFTRFDEIEESGGEQIILNSRGGAVALISTARQVYMDNNLRLHNSIAEFVYTHDEQGLPLRVGDIVRKGKNNTSRDSNNSRFLLFGDPAMRPAFPTYKIKVETINGKAIDPNNMPVFQARQTLTFAGSVVDAKGNKLSDFNGPLVSTLFDCEQSVITHGYSTPNDEGGQVIYNDRFNKLAVNVDTVTNGTFSFRLTIPSEVMATYDNFQPAWISLYAYDNHSLSNKKWNGGLREAQGSNGDFYIYGYDDTIVADTIGPEISVFAINSVDFKDGDDVNESPLVLATVRDKSGINLSTSGIGHSITLTLDDEKTFNDVTSFYTPIATDEGTAGDINYVLQNLENGHHTLTIKVWDVFNNSSEKSVVFNVVTGLKPDLYDIYTDANPASVSANFYVKHNRPDAVLTIRLEIYDLLGRMVWSTTQTGRSDLNTSFPISWDLTDMSGHRVPRGIYVYRASVSTDGEREATKSRKIAVTAQ